VWGDDGTPDALINVRLGRTSALNNQASFFLPGAPPCSYKLRPILCVPNLFRTTGGTNKHKVKALPRYKHSEHPHTLHHLSQPTITMSAPLSPYGLPTSPRANRPMLSPIDTTFSANQSQTPTNLSPYSDKSSVRTLVEPRHHRNQDSLIFINATIPLSPSSTSSSRKADPYEGLTPRKRSGFARLFCCFGREERARRRVARDTEFEKVGEAGHWTEY
jgi:hypothetical protein